jgi:hypothetical protein
VRYITRKRDTLPRLRHGPATYLLRRAWQPGGVNNISGHANDGRDATCTATFLPVYENRANGNDERRHGAFMMPRALGINKTTRISIKTSQVWFWLVLLIVLHSLFIFTLRFAFVGFSRSPCIEY